MRAATARAQPLGRLVERHRRRDAIALEQRAAERQQLGALGLGHLALGQAPDAEVARQGDQRLDDRLLLGVVLNAGDEAAIDLDAIDLELFQASIPGVAGAEVVELDREAEFLQRRDIRDRRVGGVVQQHALDDLERDVRRLEPGADDQRLQPPDEAPVAQLPRREVDADPRGLEPLPTPAPERLERGLDHDLVEGASLRPFSNAILMNSPGGSRPRAG